MSAVEHRLVKALRTVPDFAGLDDRTLLKIVGTSVTLFWPAESIVFTRGEPAEGVYIVMAGEVRILEDTGGDEKEVARIGPGDYFGELSMLLHTTHSKTADAVQDTELMVIPKASFQELLAATPELAAQFRRKVEQRMPGPASGSVVRE